MAHFWFIRSICSLPHPWPPLLQSTQVADGSVLPCTSVLNHQNSYLFPHSCFMGCTLAPVHSLLCLSGGWIRHQLFLGLSDRQSISKLSEVNPCRFSPQNVERRQHFPPLLLRDRWYCGTKLWLCIILGAVFILSVFKQLLELWDTRNTYKAIGIVSLCCVGDFPLWWGFTIGQNFFFFLKNKKNPHQSSLSTLSSLLSSQIG